MSGLRSWVRFGVYPGLMGASAWGTLSALDAGAEGGVAVLAVNVAAALVVAGLERALPYRSAWNRSLGDVRADALHTAFNGAAGELGRGLTVAALTAASGHLSRTLGAALWPAGWPLAAQLALALPVAELGVYWLHRIEHGQGFFWRLHAVHHSAPRLYVLNGARNHPLDAALSLSVLVAPLALLGAGERLMALAMSLWGVHALLQHSNVDIRLGPLNHALSAAEVHRWHHSRRPEESLANFGQTLLLWDLVFGTWRALPAREPPLDVGLAGLPGYPAGWLGQLASPFARSLWCAARPIDAPSPRAPAAP